MSRAVRPARLVRRALVLAVVAALLWVGSVAARVWWTARQDATPASDAIVVLGASQFDGRPSAVFRARLDHARALWERGVAPRIVTVGGNRPGDRFTEAASGRAYLIREGVPAGRVVAVEGGGDTEESLALVGEVFGRRGWRSAVLVSDPWHSLRARAMARDAGLDADTSPARTGPIVASRGTQARYIARETLAYAWWRASLLLPDRPDGSDGPDVS